MRTNKKLMRIKRTKTLLMTLALATFSVFLFPFIVKTVGGVFADDTLDVDCSDLSCGSTAREKYWIALSKYFSNDESGNIHKAGIMGNMWEEGQFSPTSWECGNVISMDGSGRFLSSVTWDLLYNHAFNSNGDNNVKGVGSVGITWDLSVYLHWLNDNAPDLLVYLQNPTEYSYNYCRCTGDYCGYSGSELKPGDQTLAVMGEAAFNKFVGYEVTYMMEYFEAEMAAVAEYKATSFSTPGAAARWWFDHYEKGVGMTNERLEEAQEAYDDFHDKDYSSCGSNAISEYIIDSANKYIELTDFKNDISGFTSKFTSGAYTVEVDTKPLNGKNVPYTGGKTKLYKNGSLVDTYTNIVRGDTDGDGAITTQDALIIGSNIMGNANILQNAYRVAGDINKDSRISVVDYIQTQKTAGISPSTDTSSTNPFDISDETIIMEVGDRKTISIGSDAYVGKINISLSDGEIVAISPSEENDVIGSDENALFIKNSEESEEYIIEAKRIGRVTLSFASSDDFADFISETPANSTTKTINITVTERDANDPVIPDQPEEDDPEDSDSHKPSDTSENDQDEQGVEEIAVPSTSSPGGKPSSPETGGNTSGAIGSSESNAYILLGVIILSTGTILAYYLSRRGHRKFEQ